MRPTRRLFASPLTPPLSLTPGAKSPPLALLPPIPLYRRLLRIHRRLLLPEERLFGDAYLKSEFQKHKDIDNPLHIIGFLTQWQHYGQTLEGGKWKGGKVDMALLDKMSDQQIGQMYELWQAIQKRGKELTDEEIDGVKQIGEEDVEGRTGK